MKIRTGFVSNSSSSSFVVKDKTKFDEALKILNEHGYDGYIFKDILYTPFLGDTGETYHELTHNDIFEELYDGGHGCPYNEDQFVEVEMENSWNNVWLPKEIVTDEDYIKLGYAPYYLSSKMYMACKNYFEWDKEKTQEDKDDFITELQNIFEGEID